MKGGVILLAITVFAVVAAGLISPVRLPDRTKSTAARQQINSFLTALGAYHLDTRKFPPSLQGLREVPEGVSGWNGPYLPSDVPTDPWGTPYVYSFDGEVRIVSLGKDRQPGGEGDAADIDGGLEK